MSNFSSPIAPPPSIGGHQSGGVGIPPLRHPTAPVESFNPAAARLIPHDLVGVGIDFDNEGRLVVAFPGPPSPTDLSKVERNTGRTVRVLVVDQGKYAMLRRQMLEVPPAPPMIESLLASAIQDGASDIHLSVGEKPRARMGARFAPMDDWPELAAVDLEAAAEYLAGPEVTREGWDGDYDCAVTFGERRLRVNVYRQRGTKAVAIRVLPSTIRSLEELSLPPQIGLLADLHKGLVLFVGATGSGKSTTQAALIDRINRSRFAHIVTIEDPVEYLHPSRNSMVHQREVGDDTESFARAMRAVLREDPDIIQIGEMRDTVTMRAAIEAAETGHLVFATLHANSAPEAIDRLVGSFPEGEQNQIRMMLATALEGVVYQVMAPDAKNPRSRWVCCQIMRNSTSVRNMIKQGKIDNLVGEIQTGANDGMLSLEQHLAMRVQAGQITAESAKRLAISQPSLDEYLRRPMTGGSTFRR